MKTLHLKRLGSIMIVASLLMLLSSCHGNRKRLFPSKLKDSYLITYSKNEIVVESDGIADHFIYKNGEYFTSCGSDSIVFFSTVEDYNIIKVSDEGHNYEIIIEKEKNGVYKTTTYYVTNQGCYYPAISYSYDSNYKILQVEKFRNIVYK